MLVNEGASAQSDYLADPRSELVPAAEDMDDLVERYMIGYAPLELQHVDIAPGSPTSVEFELTPGACYAVAVFSADVVDIGVDVVDGDTRVTQDVRARQGFSVAEWCSMQGDTRIDVHAYSPGGQADLMLLERIDQRRWVGDGVDVLADRLIAWQSVVAPRFAAAGAISEVSVAVPSTSEVRFNEATSGRCYVLLAVGDANVADIDILLYDRFGTLIASDQSLNAFAAVSTCPATDGALDARVMVMRGAGDIALQWFSVATNP